MGQKVNPLGLQIGVIRKWNGTWFSKNKHYKNALFLQNQVESFLKAFLYYYSATKVSMVKHVLLFDVKIFWSSKSKISIFIFFYKMRTSRRDFVKYKKKNLKSQENSSIYFQKFDETKN